MDYGHHDSLHAHRVHRFQAVEMALHHAVTMMGNQVMVTVIHTHIVMLSEAKHLAAWLARPFAEFTLERSEGLRVTHFGNFSERLWGRPTFLSITSRLTVH